MSYTRAQIEQANAECRYLGGRKGEGTLVDGKWYINPDFGGNPLCKKDEPSVVPSEEEEIKLQGTASNDTKTAGFMGLPNLAWIAIGGVILYYAYQKGMFKKFLK